MTKDEAREEALRRWRALPEQERRTFTHVQVLAAGLVEELGFRTMGNTRRMIEAWLWREVEDTTRRSGTSVKDDLTSGSQAETPS